MQCYFLMLMLKSWLVIKSSLLVTKSCIFFLLDINTICVTFHLWINKLIKRKDHLLILYMWIIFPKVILYFKKGFLKKNINLRRFAQILNKESFMWKDLWMCELNWLKCEELQWCSSIWTLHYQFDSGIIFFLFFLRPWWKAELS